MVEVSETAALLGMWGRSMSAGFESKLQHCRLLVRAIQTTLHQPFSARSKVGSAIITISSVSVEASTVDLSKTRARYFRIIKVSAIAASIPLSST